jgi:hypothetical protein
MGGAQSYSCHFNDTVLITRDRNAQGSAHDDIPVFQSRRPAGRPRDSKPRLTGEGGQNSASTETNALEPDFVVETRALLAHLLKETSRLQTRIAPFIPSNAPVFQASDLIDDDVFEFF